MMPREEFQSFVSTSCDGHTKVDNGSYQRPVSKEHGKPVQVVNIDDENDVAQID